jgi:predicted nucleic acid-binding protein
MLCREFDISRKTGHKIFNRYKDCGLEGLTDRSRRPYRQANRLPFQVENLIVQLKKEHPTWGAPRKKLAVLDDEPDNRILECAVTGHADVVVTGDRAMLNLKKYREIRMLSLRQFLDKISVPNS